MRCGSWGFSFCVYACYAWITSCRRYHWLQYSWTLPRKFNSSSLHVSTPAHLYKKCYCTAVPYSAVYCFHRPFESNRLKMIDWVVRYINSNNNSYTCRKWCHRKWCIKKAASNNFFVNKLLPKIRNLFSRKR